MNTAPQISAEEIKGHLLEVLNTCPADQCNPPDCPLYQLRQRDFPGRIQWLNSLPLAELEYLAAYHHVCLKVKMATP